MALNLGSSISPKWTVMVSVVFSFSFSGQWIVDRILEDFSSLLARIPKKFLGNPAIMVMVPCETTPCVLVFVRLKTFSLYFPPSRKIQLFSKSLLSALLPSYS